MFLPSSKEELPLEILKRHLKIWQEKPSLREIYKSWHEKILTFVNPEEIVLEIGSGPGTLKAACPKVITSDIIACPWVDVVCDAGCLPFGNESLGTIVMIDVLHHLAHIPSFFDETLRTLKPSGRICFLEPYISPLSFPVYRWLHHEKVDMASDFIDRTKLSSDPNDPFDANQAAATVLFWKKVEVFKKLYPQLKIIHKSRSDYLAYPLSGGFNHNTHLPAWFLKILKKIESRLPFLSFLCAFRTMIVLEKESASD